MEAGAPQPEAYSGADTRIGRIKKSHDVPPLVVKKMAERDCVTGLCKFLDTGVADDTPCKNMHHN